MIFDNLDGISCKVPQSCKYILTFVMDLCWETIERLTFLNFPGSEWFERSDSCWFPASPRYDSHCFVAGKWQTSEGDFPIGVVSVFFRILELMKFGIQHL